MSEQHWFGDNWELIRRQHFVTIVGNAPQPDPHWTYTDQAGHFHARRRWAPHYPLLVDVNDGDPYWCIDCRDEHQDSHLECRLCGEHIDPGQRGPSPFGERVLSSEAWTLLVSDMFGGGIRERELVISSEDANAILSAMWGRSRSETIKAGNETVADIARRSDLTVINETLTFSAP